MLSAATGQALKPRSERSISHMSRIGEPRKNNAPVASYSLFRRKRNFRWWLSCLVRKGGRSDRHAFLTDGGMRRSDPDKDLSATPLGRWIVGRSASGVPLLCCFDREIRSSCFEGSKASCCTATPILVSRIGSGFFDPGMDMMEQAICRR